MWTQRELSFESEPKMKLLEVSDCSVITATYSVDGINLGTIGVIGPTRMDYGKVISALEYVRKRLLSE